MELIDAIRSRKSVRRYSAEPVSRETILELVELATLAPNGSNAQQWDFVIVESKEVKEKLADIIAKVHHEYYGTARVDSFDGERLVKMVSMYENMKNVPYFVVFCVNMRNTVFKQEYNDYAALSAEHSIAAAITTFMVAAANKGLGTCWFGTPVWKGEEIKNLLNIPASVRISAITPVGYPEGKIGTRPRLPLEEVTHIDKW